MARYKPIDTRRRFLAVALKRQRLAGTFEHALDHLLDHEIDLPALDARFKNDETGASAYAAGDVAQGDPVCLLARHCQRPRD